jgi:hypothetical protein
MRSAPRKALAAIGSEPPPKDFDMPKHLSLPLSPVARGRIYEAWRNRLLDPSTWLHITAEPNGGPKYGPHDPAAACRAPPSKPKK